MSNIDYMSAPIASRQLPVRDPNGSTSSVGIVVGTPVPDPLDPLRTWACPYQIRALGRVETRAIFGIDAMQALILCLHVLPSELRALARETGIRFLDESDLGLSHACRTHLDLAG
jgi:hypothetical protein